MPAIIPIYRPDLAPEDALYEAIWALDKETESLHLRTPAKLCLRRKVMQARQAFCRCFPARTSRALFPQENPVPKKETL